MSSEYLDQPARSELEATKQKLQQVQEIAGELAKALGAWIAHLDGPLDAPTNTAAYERKLMANARRAVPRARALGLMGE